MNSLLQHIDDFLKMAEEAFTYEKIFDSSGVTTILEEMYVTPKDLPKDYINILFNAVKEFIAQPLYKDVSLEDEKDLKFLSSNDQYKSKIRDTIKKIKKELDSRTVRVMKEIENYGSKKEISLEELSKAVKLDRASLLFILDDLRKRA